MIFLPYNSLSKINCILYVYGYSTNLTYDCYYPKRTGEELVKGSFLRLSTAATKNTFGYRFLVSFQVHVGCLVSFRLYKVLTLVSISYNSLDLRLLLLLLLLATQANRIFL